MVSGVSSSFSKPAVPRRACGILLVSLIAVPYRNGCQGGLTDLPLLSLLSNWDACHSPPANMLYQLVESLLKC